MSLGSYLVETAVTLLAVLVLAGLVLYGGRRIGFGAPSGPLELVGRLPLDARRAVYLVRVGSSVYVLGVSEAGLVRLGEVDAASMPPVGSSKPARRFRDVLARVAERAAASESVAAPSEGPPAVAVDGAAAEGTTPKAPEEAAHA